MKRFSLTFAILLLMSLKSSLPTTMMLYGDREEILKGRVKRLIETGLTRGGGEFLMQYADSVQFDGNGRQLAENGSFGAWYYRIDFNFDFEDGHKSLELPWPRAIEKREYDFNDKGNLIEARYYNEDGFFEKRTLSYDDAGKLVEIESLDKKNVIHHKIKLSYGENGLLSEEAWFPWNSNHCSSSTLYKYLAFDKCGNWIKRYSIEKNCNEDSIYDADTVTRKITYY